MKGLKPKSKEGQFGN